MTRLARVATSLIFGFCFGLGWLACARTPIGATVEDIARAQAQTQPGASVFAAECASCHGQRGEGLAGAPAIMGPGALPEYPRTSTTAGDPTITDPQLLQIRAQTRPAGAAWRDPFKNAADLQRFTTLHVPKARAEQLKDADYWAVVGFILAAQGATLPPGGLGPANAASIPIPQR
jgi:mono/diheme cytochrome c family protein